MTQNTGKVWLVGAGPGDPGLLTLRAVEALQQAQAVVYDRLVSEAVMQRVKAEFAPGAQLYFAGKSCERKTMPQEEMNQLLVQLARQGLRVVRLKGGDPFFFGRGGEEALALKAAHIPFEIIPGITSAQGCAAYAGIPLTHRGLAAGVRYITGHRTESQKDEPLNLNWPGLADPDTTLVVYMGLANLAVIAEKLVQHGLPPGFPAAAISHGTTPAQRVLLSTLSELAADVAKAQLGSPVLVVIGKVAKLPEELAWFAETSAAQGQDYFTPMACKPA